MWQRGACAALLGCSLCFCAATSAAIELVSRIEGQPTLATGANRGSGNPSISESGRYVAFSSGSSNLLSGDNSGGVSGVFVYDRETDSTELLTAGGNGNSFSPSISANGRIVAFASSANNLAAGDTNGNMFDTYVHDRDTNTTELLTAGANGNSFDVTISADGRFVGYTSDADNLVSADNNDIRDVFIYDRNDGTTQRLTNGGNGESRAVSISGDGHFVTYSSQSSNLVIGDTDTNGTSDIFVYDRATNETQRLTLGGNSSSFSPSISDDGRFVTYQSFANNLVAGDFNGRSDVFLHDRETSFTENLTAGGNQNSTSSEISADGTFVSFRSNATNLTPDELNGTIGHIFVYNRQTQTRTLVTTGANESSSSPTISGDGQLIAFQSSASNLVSTGTTGISHVVLYDQSADEFDGLFATNLAFEVAGGNGDSESPSVSADGQFVAYESGAANLTNPDSNGNRDIFVYNRVTGTNESLTPQGNAASRVPSISGDGRYVTFESSASNLVSGDTNAHRDIFVYDRDTEATELITPGGNADSSIPVISSDGRFVAFESAASNLVAEDSNGNVPDVFLYDRTTASTALLTAGGNSDSRAPAISADGRFVAFASQATNLVDNDSTSNIFDVFVYDRITNNTELLTTAGNSSSLEPSISGDGQFVAFESHASNLAPGDTNGNTRDIFLHNRNDGTTALVTAGSTVDNFGNTSISADGEKLAFTSSATNLVDGDINARIDVFLYNRASDNIELVTQGADGDNTEAAISADGRAIAFTSRALNLANNGTLFTTDVFVSVSNDPPTANPFTTTTNEDTPIAVTISGSDPEEDELSFLVVTQPTNGELTGTPPNLVYSPSSNFFGIDSFTFVANDGTGNSTPATVDINVSNVNDAPVGVGATDLSTPEDTPFSITLTGTDIENDALTYAITNPPTNGNLFGTAPDLIYSPADNFNGSDSFSFTVSDGLLTSVPTTIVLTVLASNDTPIAASQMLTTSSDAALAITLAGSDADNEPLSFAVVDFPTNGSLSGIQPNLIYTPANNFTGTDSFTFTVSDATSTSEPASISITVVEAPTIPGIGNLTPIAQAQSISAPRETPVSILLSGTDFDGDALTFDFVSLPANGNLSGTAPELIYTPDTNFIGLDSFSFTVSDEQDTSEPASVSITVSDGTIELFSAVLPASRSVEVGATATAFATLINAGSIDAQGCRLQLPDTLPAEFFYQATDPSSNAAVGEPNQVANIPAGTSQSFIFGITPSEAMSATEVAVAFDCANATEAASFVGLNTLLLSASVTPVPDLIALVATVTNNGVMEIANNSGFLTAATINVGSTATINVSADTGNATLPMTLSLCQTDPATSVCINPTVPSTEPVVVEIAGGDSPTFAVFANATGSIALDPANSRVFLRFSDELGEVRGTTSVAVQNAPEP